MIDNLVDKSCFEFNTRLRQEILKVVDADIGIIKRGDIDKYIVGLDCLEYNNIKRLNYIKAILKKAKMIGFLML